MEVAGSGMGEEFPSVRDLEGLHGWDVALVVPVMVSCRPGINPSVP